MLSPLKFLAVSPGKKSVGIYYSPVSVNSGQVPSTQTDYPFRIYQTDARLKDVAHGGHVARSDGFDIRPYSDSGLTTALTYELAFYDPINGTLEMYVKESSFSDSTVVYLKYGDTSITTDGSSTATWSNNFVRVYHFGDGTTLGLKDSTGTEADLVNHSATAAAGIIGGGVGLVSASSQYLSGVGSISAGDHTLSIWVKANSFPNAYNDPWGFASNYKDLFVKSTGKLAFYATYGSGVDVSFDGTGSSTLSSGTWYYLTMTLNHTTGDLKGYLNSTLEKTVNDGNPGVNFDTSSSGMIGQDPGNSGRFWDGIIDEARASSVVRSPDWITTEYNEGFPATFETLGTEVPV